jgi:cation diffusion facilitator CzcD-associated flavoprotein CzcO
VADGIELESGKKLDADIIISATGLKVRFFGGVEVHVDGKPVRVQDTMAYKGVLLSGVPNLAFTVGYTNASWTLKVDLVCEYVTNLLAEMAAHGYTEVVVERDPSVAASPFMDMEAGYLLRAQELMPRKGDRGPWQVRQSYLYDMKVLSADIRDSKELQFS